MFSTRESTYHLMNGNTYYRGEWGLKCHTCRPHEAIPLVRMTQTLLMDDRVTPSVPKEKHEVTFWNCLYSFYGVRTGQYVSIELYISKTFAFLTGCLHFIGRVCVIVVSWSVCQKIEYKSYTGKMWTAYSGGKVWRMIEEIRRPKLKLQHNQRSSKWSKSGVIIITMIGETIFMSIDMTTI